MTKKKSKPLELTHIVHTRLTETEFTYLEQILRVALIKNTCIAVVLYQVLKQHPDFESHWKHLHHYFVFSDRDANEMWDRLHLGSVNPDTAVDRVAGRYCLIGSTVEDCILNYIDAIRKVFADLVSRLNEFDIGQNYLFIQSAHMAQRSFLSFRICQRKQDL